MGLEARRTRPLSVDREVCRLNPAAPGCRWAIRPAALDLPHELVEWATMLIVTSPEWPYGGRRRGSIRSRRRPWDDQHPQVAGSSSVRPSTLCTLAVKRCV
ncbi:hypothetical protein C3K23_00310 (plasmid) [Streptomyces sp. 604F]|nr:hypothetical protein C3K23_00310 [Streptomyces sp. 604F]